MAVTSRARPRYSETSRRAKKNGSVNGKFIQRRSCELAAKRYDEPHLKSLQYDIHRYQPYNIRKPLSIACREPKRGLRVHYSQRR